MSETDRIREAYARRTAANRERLYEFLDPSVYLAVQEKERALVRWISTCGIAPLGRRRVFEVGCGSGDDLVQFIRLGFRPEHLVGCELLTERAEEARRRLPEGTTILCGDATEMEPPGGPFDVVMHSTVFTSILDDAFQRRLADRMWELTRSGGGVLWYDFAFDNPRNRDVRGVPLSRVRELFPHAAGPLRSWRLTLAPPIGRPLARLHPRAYSTANLVAWLRVARLCWIAKA